MNEHDDVTHEELLRIWSFRREMFNHYSRALGMLMLDGAWQQQRELRAKLAHAEAALREASEQLRFYEITLS